MMKKELAVMVGVIAILLFAFNSNADAGLISWWKMDEATSGSADGKTINDACGTNDGTANDGANNAGMTWTTGKSGGALSFDGVDDYVGGPGVGNLQTQTWEAWIYREVDSGTYERFLSRPRATINSYAAFLMINKTDKLTGKVTVVSGTDVTSESSASIPVGVWTHVAMVFDVATNTNTLYIDGVQDGSVSGAVSVANTSQGFDIGRLESVGTWYYGFDGLIDDVRFWDQTLTSDQILWHYDNPGQIIPEPSALLLLGTGLLGLLVFKRKMS